MKIGFIGLGNVGGKLANSLLRNGFDLTVRDLNDTLVQSFVDRGATSAASPKEMTEKVDLIITCLPSPTVCSTVMESEDGIIGGLSEGKIWLEMNTTYEAIRISSGNSFVHETESQVILNGSRDINFTMDLVVKDVGLFDKLANINKVPVEISPLVLKIFKNGQERYGPREFSPNIIKCLEEACDIQVLGTGFPAEMTDDEPEEPGYEVKPR